MLWIRIFPYALEERLPATFKNYEGTIKDYTEKKNAVLIQHFSLSQGDHNFCVKSTPFVE